MRIVEVLEGHQFVFQVRRRPEQQLIHAFSSQRADQPFDKRMRQRHIRHTLHLGHLQHPQVGAPLVKPIQRVVVGAEARRTREPSNRMVEHAAQGAAIHGSSMDAQSRRSAACIGPSPPAPNGFAGSPTRTGTGRCSTGYLSHAPGMSARTDHPSGVPVDSAWRALGAPRPCRCRPQRRARSVGRSADSPHLGLRRFMSTMASTSALDGPWGPVRRRVGENSQRYLRVRRARWNSRIVDGLSTTAERITPGRGA